MKWNSITFKLLSLLVGAAVILVVSVLLMADIQLTRIIDESQDAVYAEKIEAIWGSLHRSNERLKKTGLVEAYADDFKESALKDLRQTYYKHADQPIYPFIIDRDGKVVMHPALPEGDLSLEQTEIVRKMLASNQGNFDYTYLGQKKWCLFKQFQEWNWVIGYTAPLDIKYGDARKFRNLLVYIMGGITFLVLLVLSLIVTRFTKPITRLTNISTAMADGDLDQQIDLGGADEVGTLARSFSHMRDSIRQTISELEKENIERRKTEKALNESKELYRSLVENINMGITLIDQDHNIVMANAAQGKMFNKATSEFTGKKCFQEFEKGDHICSHCPGVTAMKEGCPKETIGQGQRDDGSTFFVNIKAFPLQGKNGENKGFIEVVEDITEQLKTQQNLAAEKERLAVTLRSIGDGVITTDISGNIVLLNKVAENLTGWSNEEAAGRPLKEVFHIINEQTREICENPVAKVISSGQIVGLANHTALVARDGTERSIADSGAPILDDQSNIIGVVLVFRDVTEQIKTEKELLKVKKLESISVLAGGIAHDFNNILAAILGNINLALFDTDLKGKTKKFLSEAEKASLRARDLTQQLLTFAKGGEPVKESSSLESVIKDSANFVLHGDKVACRYDIPENLWLVDIDKGQISQVVQNIVLNASHAMPNGGTIQIICENIDPLHTESAFLPRDKKFVRVTITDSGIGIPKNVIDKIFDPYFSTKQEGSGLGLAISHSIITKHNGHISVQSTPGVGTTFTIYLPVSAHQQEKEKREETIEEGKVKAKIMVMDDEELIRGVAQSMLSLMGHEVVLVQDGTEALELYREQSDSGEPIDIIIMDLTIPGGMGGKDAVKEILAFDPHAKVIVSSGYSNDPAMANCQEYGFVAAVVKPYQLQELAKVINQVLRNAG